MSIHVIRHADKEQGYFHTENLRFNDQPINGAGREKAQRLAAYFAHMPIDSIHVSEYRRTMQTIAQGISQPVNLHRNRSCQSQTDHFHYRR